MVSVMVGRSLRRYGNRKRRNYESGRHRQASHRSISYVPDGERGMSWLRQIVAEGKNRELTQIKPALPVRALGEAIFCETRVARPTDNLCLWKHIDLMGMRHDRLRAAAVTMRRLGFRHHCEGVARRCYLSGSVGDTRLGSTLIRMLIEADRVLRHTGRR